MKKILPFIISLIFISCGEDKSSTSDMKNTISMEGFWDRIGTVQIVNGVSVDTIFWSELDEKDRPTQIKAYVDGYTAWVNNGLFPNNELFKNTPWINGGGAFGKYTFNPESKNNDNMTEFVTNLTGMSVIWAENDAGAFNSVKTKGVAALKFKATLTEKNYTQLGVRDTTFNNLGSISGLGNGGNTTQYAEYYEKASNTETSKIDGVWNHIANVNYVNKIPIDTISVPEGLADHKIFYKGNVIVNYDFTNAQEGDDNWGGATIAGKFNYENNILTEDFYVGTGNWMPLGTKWPSRKYDIDWINDDSFIQIFSEVPKLDSDGNPVLDENGQIIWVEAGKESNGLLHVRVE